MLCPTTRKNIAIGAFSEPVGAEAHGRRAGKLVESYRVRLREQQRFGRLEEGHDRLHDLRRFETPGIR